MDVSDWTSRMQQNILGDKDVEAVHILDLAQLPSEPHWTVVLGLNRQPSSVETRSDSEIIKRARKVLIKNKKETGSDIAIPKQWMILDELKLYTVKSSLGGRIDEAALKRRLIGTPTEKSLELVKEKVKKATVSRQPGLKHEHPDEATGLGHEAESYMEEVLTILWSHVLKIPPDEIGLEDSFLERGGDSLLAIELTSLALHCDIDLAVSSIFYDPRLHEMAKRANPIDEDGPRLTPPFSLLQPEDVDEILGAVKEQCDLGAHQVIEDAYPCTPLQEGLMALAVRQPGSYVTRQAYLLPLDTDLERFRQAWDRTVRKCSILRTRIILHKGEAIQAVLSGAQSWEKGLDDQIEDPRTAPVIEIRYGAPLCRYTILQETTMGRSHFVWTMHHAVYDGWTVKLVLDILHKEYHRVSDITIYPFSSFIEHLVHLDSHESEVYWRCQLKGATKSHFPKTEGTRVGVASNPVGSRHARKSFNWPTSSNTSFTKATILRAAWALVLARYCETDDVCFGSTVSGRQAPILGLDMIPGPVVATVPVRVNLAGEKPVASFLAEMQTNATEMIAHEQFGLRNIANLGADEKDACDFASLFVVQPAMSLNPQSEAGDPVLELGDLAQEAIVSYFNYPLVLQCQIKDDGFDLVVSHDSTMLDDWTVEVLFQHFHHVVEQLVTMDHGFIREISLAGPWDLEQVSFWNQRIQTDIVYNTVHDLFLKQADKRPEHQALYSTSETMTYGELAGYSATLAKHLVELGVVREQIVPVCFEKSIWAVVAMIAILRAGAAFVPLDLAHPHSWRKHLIGQVGAHGKHLLVSSSQHEMYRQISPLVIEVSKSSILSLPQVAHFERQDSSKALPNNLCYALFTSGTTGRPKGILVEHSALLTNLRGMNKTDEAGPSTRWLQFSSFIWDASIKEIFGTLIFGGTLCMPTEEQRLGDVAAFMTEAKVNVAALTPSFIRVLNPSKVPALKTLVTCGEAANQELLKIWQDKVKLINAYGPAEAAVVCMAHVFSSPDGQPNNIGRGVHGAMWLVEPDDVSQLTPVGCVGEILIHGHGIARGYNKDEQRTAERFISKPRWLPASFDHESWKFFRSGDLARYNSDGSMQFMGRHDTQVKIRGQRLELGEVEAATKRCYDGIDHVAVDVISVESRKTLIAFMSFTKETLTTMNVMEDGTPSLSLPSSIISASPQLEAAIIDICARLKDLLPSFKIPTYFLPMTQLPFVSAMKLDRRKLCEIAQKMELSDLAEYTSGNVEKIEPITDMEFKLRDLWAEALKIEPKGIGRQDNFLQIGGDSIGAIQLVSLANGQGIGITAPLIFAHPTLDALAEMAKDTGHSSDEATNLDLKPFAMIPGGYSEALKSHAFQQCRLAEGDEIEDAYPCTALQEGLMALSEKQPGSYVAKQVYRLDRKTNVARFRSAWERTVEVCSNLRTRVVVYGSSIQVIVKNDKNWEEQGDGLNTTLAKLGQASMKYGDPLCRYALIQEDGHNFFAWAIHHAIFDGWSMQIMLQTLQQVYEGLEMKSLPSFLNFIHHISHQSYQEAEAFWTKQLQGAEKAAFPSPMGLGRSSGSSRSFRKTFQMPPPVGKSFTKATILRTTWAIVLARYCNTKDICFGAMASGRQAPVAGIERMAGPTLATVPVRLKLDDRQLVPELLDQVQAQASEVVAFEQFGLQNMSKLNREAREACDFGSLLVIQPLSRDSHNLDTLMSPAKAGEDFSTTQAMEGYFHYPLVIQVLIHEEFVELQIAYHSNVLATPQIEALARHYEHVVHQLYNVKTDTILESIRVTTPWDEQMARGWNKTPEVVESRVQDLIAVNTRKTPDKEAIYHTGGSISYGVLNEMTDRLANHLAALGVKPDVRVPVCFEKSIWAIVAMIGILKAGGSFVPLDPDHPQSRRQDLVTELEATVIIASSRAVASCQGMTEQVIELDGRFFSATAPASTASEEVNHIPEPSSSNVAYILFTSGSTGKPKGVVVEHGALCSSMVSHAREFGMNENTRTFQFSSYAFDVCLAEIFTTLVVGGTVCVPTPDERMDDAPGFMRQARVNTAMLTPSFLRTFGPEQVPDLKLLVAGGEAAGKDTLETWYGSGTLRVINGYGPAECCLYCIAHEYERADETPTTIGKNLHTASWIVEPGNVNRLAPINCVGELLIQGRGMARGYFKDEKRTTQAFIEGPTWLPKTSDARNNRLYRTGDLAKYDYDGMMCYMGRADLQVKLRGQRIELGEVEYHLKKGLPKIKRTGVDISKRETGDVLVAFFTTESYEAGLSEEVGPVLPMSDGLRADISNIRSYLEDNLPTHMIPQVFLPLKEMPLVIAMKLDRRCLREIVNEMSAATLNVYSLGSLDKTPPATRMEQKLQKIWSLVLRLKESNIGRHDNFLRIGGDSISAIHLVAAARKQAIELSVATIFKTPKLLDMAAVATEKNGLQAEENSLEPYSLLDQDEVSSILSEVKSQCGLDNELLVEDAYPCTPLQEGLMALAVTQPGSYISKQCYRLPNSVDVNRFKFAWERTLIECANLRTRIILVGQQAIQVSLREAPCWEQAKSFDHLQNMVVTYGSAMCRYCILSQDDETYFLVAAHHAINDGWSLRLMLETLQAVYYEHAIVPMLPYGNFIKYIKGINDADMAHYWQTELKGARRINYPATNSMASSAKDSSTRLVRKTIAMPALIEDTVTQATIVRAAWALVLSRYVESDDVCFGITVSGRLAPVTGLERMAGPTIATVPMRVTIQRDMSIGSFLQLVQSQALGMVKYEQFGLQNIAKLSEDAKGACNFHNLLIIQPAAGAGSKDSEETIQPNLLDDDQNTTESTVRNYFNYPLVAQAFLSEGKVELLITYSGSSGTEEDRVNFNKRDASEELRHDIRMQALAHHLEHVIRQLLVDRESLLSSISLFSPWDIECAKKGDKLTPATESCIHWKVAEQVRVNPDIEAVVSWDGSLTYAQLGGFAQKFAGRLQDAGIKRGSVVMFCLPKSKFVAVAMLAIHIIGAVFVPVDPTTPVERVRVIADSAGAFFGITTAACVKVFSGIVDNLVVAENDGLVDRETETDLSGWRNAGEPNDTSLILFTSGSTGKPKGVVITHRSVCSLADGFGSAMEIGPGRRVFNFSAYTFDVGVLDVLLSLMLGGCVCIPAEDNRVRNLANDINSMRANWVFLTPTVASLIEPAEVPNLTTLCLGGEAVDTACVRRWGDSVKLYGGYGPVEASICAWNSNLHLGNARNIGSPVSTAFWVVEPSNRKQLVPVGCVGELIVQGPVLAKGYLTDEETQSAWFESATWFPTTKPERAYCTGDLVRLNGDGTFDYIGRIDMQVKIRGQRVELGEVEHGLRQQLPNSWETIVEMIEHQDDTVLAAFTSLPDNNEVGNTVLQVLPHTSKTQEKSSEAIRGIRLRLPSYMVPQYIILVNFIPRIASSGKLDRKALRMLAAGLAPTKLLQYTMSQQRVFRECATELEQDVRGLWSAVLKIPETSISLDDNFYHLGGDSIKIVSLAQQVLRKWEISLGMKLVGGRNLTVQSMAVMIDKDGDDEEAETGALSISVAEEFTEIMALDWEAPIQKLVECPCVDLPEQAVVLVTGATGYLGTEILSQLVRRTEVGKVIVVVRCSSAEHGLQRIEQTARLAGWWQAGYREKIEVWPGDLSYPNLGLDGAQLARLSGTETGEGSNVDAIIHNGAVVNWNADYGRLREANVTSTMVFFRAAARSNAGCKFIYVSGGPKTDPNASFEEQATMLQDHIGYSQTKFMSESVVTELASRLPAEQNRVTVVKPGLIIGTAERGIANVDDFLWRAVATAASLGKYPVEEFDRWLHIADVEVVAGLVISQLYVKDHIVPFVDMRSGLPLSQAWKSAISKVDSPCEPVPMEEWAKLTLAQMEEVGDSHPFWPVQHFLAHKEAPAERPTECEGERGKEEAERLEMALRANVRYLKDVGFIASKEGRGKIGGDGGVIRRSNMADYERDKGSE